MKAIAIFLLFLLVQGGAPRAEGLESVRKMLMEAPVLSGKPLDEEMLTNRQVVIAFFASWCPPCRAEFAALNKIAVQAEPPVTLIAVNLFENAIGQDKDGVRLARFLEKTQPRFTVVGSGDSIAMALGGVQRIPNVFVFDSNGNLGFRFIHQQDSRKMSITARELLIILREIP